MSAGKMAYVENSYYDGDGSFSSEEETLLVSCFIFTARQAGGKDKSKGDKTVVG